MSVAILYATGWKAVLERKVDAAANNIANANANGFKQAYTEIRRAGVRINPDVRLVYPYIVDVHHSFTQESLEFTNNTYDFALKGKNNLFRVVDEQGREHYTRNGTFHVDNEGILRTAAGDTIVGMEEPIPPNAKRIVVNKDGQVFADDVQIGQFQLAYFGDAALDRLVPRKDLKFYSPEPPQAAQQGGYEVVQGAVEASSVSPIKSMVHLLKLQNQYKGAQKVLDEDDKRRERGISNMNIVA